MSAGWNMLIHKVVLIKYRSPSIKQRSEEGLGRADEWMKRLERNTYSPCSTTGGQHFRPKQTTDIASPSLHSSICLAFPPALSWCVLSCSTEPSRIAKMWKMIKFTHTKHKKIIFLAPRTQKMYLPCTLTLQYKFSLGFFSYSYENGLSLSINDVK